MNNEELKLVHEFDIRYEGRTQRPTYETFVGFIKAAEHCHPAPVIERHEVTMFSIPEENLTKMLALIIEYQSLQQDPETRELVEQAKFIKELKGKK